MQETKAAAIKIAIETKDWNQLVDIVLRGEADLLIGSTSEDAELQEFINNAGTFKIKVEKIHEGTKTVWSGSENLTKYFLVQLPFSAFNRSHQRIKVTLKLKIKSLTLKWIYMFPEAFTGNCKQMPTNLKYTMQIGKDIGNQQ